MCGVHRGHGRTVACMPVNPEFNGVCLHAGWTPVLPASVRVVRMVTRYSVCLWEPCVPMIRCCACSCPQESTLLPLFPDCSVTSAWRSTTSAKSLSRVSPLSVVAVLCRSIQTLPALEVEATQAQWLRRHAVENGHAVAHIGGGTHCKRSCSPGLQQINSSQHYLPAALVPGDGCP